MGPRVDRTNSWLRPFAGGVAVAIPLSLVLLFAEKKFRGDPIHRDEAQVVQKHPASKMFETRGGRIEALRLPLTGSCGELPDGPQRLTPPRWFFAGYSDSQLDQFFRTLHAPAAHLRTLLDRQFWAAQSNGCTYVPPDALVWSLPADVRERVYRALAQSRENYPQQVPFRFPLGRFEQCLDEAGLSARRIRQLQQLTYTNAGAICLADLRAASEVLSATEFRILAEALYQVPTYRLRLHVEHNADVDALVNYWGKSGRAELIRPLLKGLSKVPSGASTSLPFLLPPYPRVHLYTYPECWHDETAAQQDCLYTALNFFNESADPALLDQATAEHVLQTQYVRATDEPTFGDIVMLTDPTGRTLHVCIYIVAEFVFTKNGANASQPWVFMNLSDVMLTYYGPSAPRNLVVLRRTPDRTEKNFRVVAASFESSLEQGERSGEGRED